MENRMNYTRMISSYSSNRPSSTVCVPCTRTYNERNSNRIIKLSGSIRLVPPRPHKVSPKLRPQGVKMKKLFFSSNFFISFHTVKYIIKSLFVKKIMLLHGGHPSGICFKLLFYRQYFHTQNMYIK